MAATQARATKKPRADAQRNQEKIIDVAEGLFTERGTDVHMQDVAEHAGVGVATVYRVFTSKEVMISVIAARQFDRCLSAVEETVRTDGASAALHAFLLRMAHVFKGRSTELRALLSELPAEQRPSEQGDLLPRLAALHERWVTEGVLRPGLDLGAFRAVICGLATAVACGLNVDAAPDLFQSGIRAQSP